DLDVDGVAPEDLDKPIEVGGRVGGPVLLEGLRDAPRETAGERDDSLRVPPEEIEVDARLVVVPLEIARRGELDQVPIALVRLGEEREVRIALRLREPVLRDVDLAPDDRLDAVLAGLAVELDGAGVAAVVGERDGRHL